jgi:glycosyltransferase involved in cell wall biosynthesis
MFQLEGTGSDAAEETRGAANRPLRPRRVHWLSWQPMPFNDYLFQNLAKDPNIDLVVHFRSKTLASHPWKSGLGCGYSARYYATVCGVDWHLMLTALKERHAFVVIAGWDHLTSQLLLTSLRLLGRSYALWTDTPNMRRRSLLHGYLRRRWLRWLFAAAVRILVTGKLGAANLIEMGAPAERVVDFPFFVDLAAYERPDHPAERSANRPVRFVSSGRISNAIKGHDIALRALALAARSTDVPFEYYIAGSGPDEAALRALACALELEGRVKCLGWLEPDRLAALYSECDVLIHPSRVLDAFPAAVLEAMAASLVVLGSDASGSVLDRVEHGVNGFIHPAGDFEALAEHISFLLRHPERITDMGGRARATAEVWPIERGICTVKEAIGATTAPH